MILSSLFGQEKEYASERLQFSCPGLGRNSSNAAWTRYSTSLALILQVAELFGMSPSGAEHGFKGRNFGVIAFPALIHLLNHIGGRICRLTWFEILHVEELHVFLDQAAPLCANRFCDQALLGSLSDIMIPAGLLTSTYQGGGAVLGRTLLTQEGRGLQCCRRREGGPSTKKQPQ